MGSPLHFRPVNLQLGSVATARIHRLVGPAHILPAAAVQTASVVVVVVVVSATQIAVSGFGGAFAAPLLGMNT